MKWQKDECRGVIDCYEDIYPKKFKETRIRRNLPRGEYF